MYRAFIAVRLSENHQNVINLALNSLKPRLNPKGILWEPQENWHLTLRFLGNISEWQGEAILDELNKQMMRHPAFSLDAKEWCFLPNNEDRRFLALRLKLNNKMNTLYSCIERCLINLGIPKEEREFLPHITVARLSQTEIDLSALKFLPPISIPINNITLYKSQPVSPIPDYSVISKLQLPA